MSDGQPTPQDSYFLPDAIMTGTIAYLAFWVFMIPSPERMPIGGSFWASFYPLLPLLGVFLAVYFLASTTGRTQGLLPIAGRWVAVLLVLVLVFVTTYRLQAASAARAIAVASPAGALASEKLAKAQSLRAEAAKEPDPAKRAEIESDAKVADALGKVLGGAALKQAASDSDKTAQEAAEDAADGETNTNPAQSVVEDLQRRMQAGATLEEAVNDRVTEDGGEPLSSDETNQLIAELGAMALASYLGVPYAALFKILLSMLLSGEITSEQILQLAVAGMTAGLAGDFTLAGLSRGLEGAGTTVAAMAPALQGLSAAMTASGNPPAPFIQTMLNAATEGSVPADDDGQCQRDFDAAGTNAAKRARVCFACPQLAACGE